MKHLLQKKIVRWIIGIVIVIGIVHFALVLLFQPSHDRDWELGHEQMPYILYSATSSEITIENYRDFNWTDVKSADVVYKTETFDLNKMTGVDVFISHFADFEGMAHIFLSFGFSDGKRAVVSLETRREADEKFSPVLGLLRQFEIIYVVGSEEDIVGVRTGHRKERVYVYETKASAEQARVLFNLLAKDINNVYETPRIYNTLLHNCTNELTRPVEKMSNVNFPITWKTVLPGFFDEVLYELQLIDTDKPFAEIKAEHLVDNEQVDANSDTYSEDLRNSIAQ